MADVQRIGAYELRAELGRGAMGTVFEVWDAELGVPRALKLVQADLCDDPEVALRFEREMEHMAAISHPHVVRVHSAGTHEGRLYYVMTRVAGPSLQEVVQREGTLGERTAAKYVRGLATALAALHERGVVHRDLKPANVLLDEDGKALLTDFGVMKLIGDDGSRLTRTGDLLGTPVYMAPEQAVGKGVGPPVDVYALGMLLYTLLHGRPAVAGTFYEVLRKVTHGELDSPARWVSAPLRAVLAGTLASDPSKRPTATELTAELDAFLTPSSEDEPKAPARGRGLALAAAVSVVLAVLVAWSLSSYSSSSPEPKPEEPARPAPVVSAGSPASPVTPPPKVDEWLPRTTLGGGDSYECRFSPNGKRLLQASESHGARLWSVPDFVQGEYLIDDGKVRDCSFSPDGRTVALARGETIELWDAEDRFRLRVLSGHKRAVRSTAFSTNGRLLVSAGDGSNVRVWAVDSGQLLQTLNGHTAKVYFCAMSPGGKFFATASRDSTVRIWALDSSGLMRVLNDHTHRVRACAFSPDGSLLFSASRIVRVWDTTTWEGVGFDPLESRVEAAAFHPDGKRVAFVDEALRVHLWSVQKGVLLRSANAAQGEKNGWMGGCAFSPDGSLLVTAGSTTRVWDVPLR